MKPFPPTPPAFIWWEVLNRTRSSRETRVSALRTTRESALRTTRESALRTTRESALRTTRESALRTTRESALRTTPASALRTTRESALRTTLDRFPPAFVSSSACLPLHSIALDRASPQDLFSVRPVLRWIAAG
jgi:hypothetical protein